MQFKTNLGCLLIPVLFAASLCCSATVYGQLTADFTTNTDGGCSPVAVNFTNTSTGTTPSTLYNWDFGNGNSSNLQNPGAVYTKEGVYTVTLTLKDGSSISVKSKTITIYATPTVDFSASSYKGCLPVALTFISNSLAGSGTIKNYYWDFGDGNTQQTTATTLPHTYNFAGDMSVSLTVTNSFGCTKTLKKDKLIKVLPAITAQFGAIAKTICKITDSAAFINNSTGPGILTHLWNFGDGGSSALTNPKHLYTKAGLYDISLTVTSNEGCSTTTVIPGFINAALFRANFNAPALLCTNVGNIFRSTSSPLPDVVQWHINNQLVDTTQFTSFSYRFTDTGNYTVKLVNQFDGCADSTTRIVNVKQTPEINGFILTPVHSCGVPLKVNVADTTASIVKWIWYFDYPNNITTPGATTQNASYEYSKDGNYTIWLSAEAANGCKNSASQRLQVRTPVVTIASKGLPTNCGPYSIAFSAKINIDSIAGFKWDFGDGGTSTDSTPVHLYSTPGEHKVSLQYTTHSGCTGTVQGAAFIVNKIPVAAFTATTTKICGNTPVQFDAEPQDGVSYNWNFGDGLQQTEGPTTLHSYKTADSFTVRLIVTTINGCKDTMIREKYIAVLPPFAKITRHSVSCNGKRDEAAFAQQSSGAAKLLWNFGDGNSLETDASLSDIVHRYPTTGKYKILLTASTPECSVTDTATIVILLKQNPVLSSAKTSICTNENLSFSLNGLEPNPSAVATTYNHYNFSKLEYTDGTEFKGSVYNDDSAATNWTTFFNGYFQGLDKDKTGIRIILQPTSTLCADTTNILPYDVKWSNARFSLAKTVICLNEQAMLTDISATDNNIIQHTWNFGDGRSINSGAAGSIAYQYQNPGNYTIQLTVTDSFNCQSAATPAVITVNGPKAGFEAPTTAYITLPVQFSNTTNTYGSTAVKYLWQFGDRGSSFETEPEYTYTEPGSYKIRLIATDPANGCSDTAIRNLAVENFRSGFTLNKYYLSPNNCPPLLAQMKNNSVNYSSLLWDFGDGSAAEAIENPSHIYFNPGTYIITLNVFGPDGYSKKHYDTIFIKGPEAAISVNASEICEKESIHFAATSKNAVSYTWDFGDGTLQLRSDSTITHQYNTPGEYRPFLIVTDITGCQASPALNETIVIRPRPTVSFSPAQPQVCRGSITPITATGGKSYQWAPAPGLVSNPSTATINILPDADITYSVKVASQYGCNTEDSVFVKVIQPSFVEVAPVSPVCINEKVQLSASGMHSYTWVNNTNGLNSTNGATTFVQNISPGIHIYTVKGSDDSGCFTDTAAVVVTILPPPSVSIAPIEGVLFGTGIKLQTTAGNNVVKWQWAPEKYLSCTDCPAPVATPADITTYRLTVTDNNGCTATDDITVKFLCGINSAMAPSAFTPNGDGLNDIFIIKGVSTVEWMQVYDRLGNMVFEKKNFYTNDYTAGWNGMYKGKPASPGTYTYFAQIKCDSGYRFVKKGTVMLIR
jgi:gliding motility-associated-like protein